MRVFLGQHFRLLLFLIVMTVVGRNPKANICSLEYARFAGLHNEQLLELLLSESSGLGVFRGDAKDAKKLKDEIERLPHRVFTTPKIISEIAKGLNLRPSIFKKKLERVHEYNALLERAMAAPLPASVARAKIYGVVHSSLPRTVTWMRQSDLPDFPGENFDSITDAYLRFNARYHIKSRASGAGSPDTFSKAIAAVEALRAGLPIERHHLVDLRSLKGAYEEFEKVSRNLRNKKLTRTVNLQIYDYLVSKQSEVEAYFKTPRPKDEKLVVHFPVFEPEEGIFVLNVQVIDDRAHYLSLLHSYKREKGIYGQTHRALVEHAKQYVLLRHVVDEFLTELDRRPLTQRDDLKDSTKKALGELYGHFNNPEHKRLNAFDPNTPSLAYLYTALPKTRILSAGYFMRNNWARMLQVGGVGGTLWAGVEVGISVNEKSREAVLLNEDKAHLSNDEKSISYWINRCSEISEEADKSSLVLDHVNSCLDYYVKLLNEHVNPITEEKKKMNSSYNGRDEQVFVAQLHRRVTMGIIKNNNSIISNALKAEAFTQSDRAYMLQAAYGTYKIEVDLTDLHQSIEAQKNEISDLKVDLSSNIIFNKSDAELLKEAFEPKPGDSIEVVREKQKKLNAALEDISTYLEHINTLQIAWDYELDAYTKAFDQEKDDVRKDIMGKMIKLIKTQKEMLEKELTPPGNTAIIEGISLLLKSRLDQNK